MTQSNEDTPKPVRNLTLLSAILLAVLLITAGAGLFGEGIYDNWSPAKYVQESRAQDLITLVLGVPLIVLATLAVRKQKAWGIPLLSGVLAYELYVYAIYAFGAVYNVFFIGYITAASLCLYTLIFLLGSGKFKSFQKVVQAGLPRPWIAGFFLLITGVFGLIWLGQVKNSISTAVVDSGHLIFVIDLMIVLPAFAIAAVKLFQKNPFGDLLAGTLLIKFDSLCISITLGQLFRELNGISIEADLLSVFIPLGLLGLIFTGLYFKNLD